METGENESDTVADSNSQHNQVPGDVDVQHNPPLQHISAAPHLDQLAGHPLLGHGGPAGHQWGSGHVLEEPEQNEGWWEIPFSGKTFHYQANYQLESSKQI